MAAAVSRLPLPSLTERELLTSRRRRGVRALRVAPEDGSVPSTTGAKNDNAEGIRRIDTYRRLKHIGEGGFGAVYKARDLRTDEVVAIKAVRKDGGGEAALLREAALLAACAGNSAVVAFREMARGSDSDGLYLVMDYVGPSLHDLISARRRRCIPFTESETCRAMAQLLAGAASMHAHGVVHCDLKPGNVLVRENDRRLKICDLGLAMSAAVPPLDTQLQGTVGYIAPEVLLCDKDCGAPIDLWALGCIMAEIAAGEKLFPEDDLCQQLINIVNLLGIPDSVSLMPLGIAAGAPSKLREKVPEQRLSPEGFDVLLGLLQYDPRDRLTAAEALQMPWFSAMDD